MQSKTKKLLFVILSCIVAGGVVFAILHRRALPATGNPPVVSAPLEKISQEVNRAETNIEQHVTAEIPIKRSNDSMVLTPAVPFTSQAPYGDWSDPLFQNGCEEAAMVMAMAWVDGKILDQQTAESEIKKISAYEVKTFGHAVDANVYDVEKIVRGYYKSNNVSVKKNITADDIRSELAQNHVVLVPAFGRALGNPNYTAPGPITHMLVIIGWDANSKQFITNDPGTRHGAGYRYSEAVLMDAIWEYPSGADHPEVPNGADMKKAMIAMWRNS
jgi:hypothetical protein